MSIQERLQLILKMHNLTPSAFADKLGVQRSNVSHVLSGRNKPSLDFLEKIIAHFPRVNAHWLLTGKMNSTSSAEEVGHDQSSAQEESHGLKHAELGVEIEKIVEFYSDGTYRTFLPRKQ